MYKTQAQGLCGLPQPAGPPPFDDDDDEDEDDPNMNAEEYATYTAVPHIQIVITPPLPSRESLPESMRLALDAILASAPIAEQSDDSHSVAGDECPLSLEDSTHAPPSPTIPACPDRPAAPVLAPPHHSQTHHPPPAVIDTAEEPPTRNERLRRADSQMVLRRPMHVQKRADPARRYARYFAKEEPLLKEVLSKNKSWNRGFAGFGILGTVTRTILGLRNH